ncbi:MAG TPA: lysophospholipid acyltransferase family protein [Alphaproteobacteria bacterium]
MGKIKSLLNEIGNLTEAVLAYGFYGFFAIWPLDIASAMGGWIGRTVGPRMSVSKRAYKHLQIALPHLTQAEQQKIVIEMWDNLGRNVAETPHLKKLIRQNRIQLEGWEHVQNALGKGKGLLIASGHFANWEVGPVYFWDKGYPVTTVYRRPNNRYIDPLLRFTRRAITPQLLAKGHKAAAGIVRTLRQNGVVGVLVDQRMSESGTMLPFFGRPAMTGLATAQLALKTGATLVTGTYIRQNGAHFALRVHPPILPPPDLTGTDATKAMMTEVNRIFTDHIAQYPGQWLWLHRRWDSKKKPWDYPSYTGPKSP